MLVAGAAVASLGGESLETIDDERTMWQSALGAAFVGTSATTMAASLWVIVVSSTLITLSQQSVLQGHSSDEVSRVDAILSRKVADVRLFYTASIFMLLVSSLLMVWINQTLLNGLITTLIFGGFVQLAYVTIRGTYDEFGQQTSLQLSEEERQSPLSRLASLLGSLKHVHAYAPLGNQPTHHPSHHPSDPRAPPPPPPPPPPSSLPSGAAVASAGQSAPLREPPTTLSSSSVAASPRARALTSGASSARGGAEGAAHLGAPPSRSSTASLSLRSVERAAVRQGWLRKAPSWRMDSKQHALAVTGSAGEDTPTEGLPTIPATPQQDRYFVLRRDGSLSYYRAREEFELELEPRASLALERHELRRVRDAKGELAILLCQRTAPTTATPAAAAVSGGGLDASASPPPAASGASGLARGFAALFGPADPKAWCIQAKDEAETRSWMADLQVAAAATQGDDALVVPSPPTTPTRRHSAGASSVAPP
jgi:hypothetical protein